MTSTIITNTDRQTKTCFNYVASLGCACNTSLYLKQLELKLFSLPYDWIFSNLKMIQHTIEDDFKSFLSLDLINPKKNKQAGHNYYHKRLFNHHNPKEDRNNYHYYQRCIARFKTMLNSGDRKLFIHTVYQEPEKYHRHFLEFGSSFKKVNFEIKDALNFNCFLSNLTKNYVFLVIIQNPKQLESRVRKVFEKNNLIIYTLDCLGVSSGELLTNPVDNLNYQNIITQFNYDLKSIC
jgi:hypothetical protein